LRELECANVVSALAGADVIRAPATTGVREWQNSSVTGLRPSCNSDPDKPAGSLPKPSTHEPHDWVMQVLPYTTRWLDRRPSFHAEARAGPDSPAAENPPLPRRHPAGGAAPIAERLPSIIVPERSERGAPRQTPLDPPGRSVAYSWAGNRPPEPARCPDRDDGDALIEAGQPQVYLAARTLLPAPAQGEYSTQLLHRSTTQSALYGRWSAHSASRTAPRLYRYTIRPRMRS